MTHRPARTIRAARTRRSAPVPTSATPVATPSATAHWELHETRGHPGLLQYVNADTVDPADGWTTLVPLDPVERAAMRAVPTVPKAFVTRAEALPYLRSIRAHRRQADARDRALGWHGPREHWELVRVAGPVRSRAA